MVMNKIVKRFLIIIMAAGTLLIITNIGENAVMASSKKAAVKTSMSSTVSYNSQEYKFNADYSYPVISGKTKGIKKINQLIRRDVEKWDTKIADITQSFIAEEADYDYSYIVRYEVTYNKKGKVSIVYSTTFNNGVNNGKTTYSTRNYDLKKGKKIDVRLRINKKSKTAKKYACKKVKEFLKRKKYASYKTAVKKIETYSITKYKFYMSKNGICAIFNPGEVAPSNVGAVRIRIK